MESRQPVKDLIWQLDESIGSFVTFCAEDSAGGDDALSGTLAGITVGVKDIIDVAGVPTRNGSAACAESKPAQSDAAVVAALRASGAHIVGKTTTTEFAFTDPTDCRNPYDLQRTPGGSSSGSGAAVAAGLVDMALGTQTAGSLCRPAAYCGVIGFKPSFGLLSTEGVTPLASSFDTIGIIARSLAHVRTALFAASDLHVSNRCSPVGVGKFLLPTAQRAAPETFAAFAEAADALQKDHGPIVDIDLEADLHIGPIVAAHRCVMLAEAARAHGHLLQKEYMDLLRPNFRAGLQAGVLISPEEIADAHELLQSATAAFWEQTAGFEMILSLAVPDGAPLLDGTTGFQDWLTPWTVFGGPLVCVPWGLDSKGRPRSVMLAGRPGCDIAVLDMAERLVHLSPPMPLPVSFGD